MSKHGTGKPDHYTGSDGNDVYHGLGGDDYIFGAIGNDKLYGDAGADAVYGAVGNDTLYGGAGDDHLYGDMGAQDEKPSNDALFGGAGNDILSGNVGKDKLTGGGGADTFVFYSTPKDAFTIDSEVDIITDFKAAGKNHDYAEIFTNGNVDPDYDSVHALMTQKNGNVEIVFDKHHYLVFEHMKIAQLSSDDFFIH
jgi:Ca2+-binding RTX toxin-like protein